MPRHQISWMLRGGERLHGVDHARERRIQYILARVRASERRTPACEG
jgi:hypothetical protein